MGRYEDLTPEPTDPASSTRPTFFPDFLGVVPQGTPEVPAVKERDQPGSAHLMEHARLERIVLAARVRDEPSRLVATTDDGLLSEIGAQRRVRTGDRAGGTAVRWGGIGPVSSPHSCCGGRRVPPVPSPTVRPKATACTLHGSSTGPPVLEHSSRFRPHVPSPHRGPTHGRTQPSPPPATRRRRSRLHCVVEQHRPCRVTAREGPYGHAPGRRAHRRTDAGESILRSLLRHHEGCARIR